MPLRDTVKVGNVSVNLYTLQNRGRDFIYLKTSFAGTPVMRAIRRKTKADDARARAIARELATAIWNKRADHISEIGAGARRVLKNAEDALSGLDIGVDEACREYALHHSVHHALKKCGLRGDVALLFVKRLLEIRLRHAPAQLEIDLRFAHLALPQSSRLVDSQRCEPLALTGGSQKRKTRGWNHGHFKFDEPKSSHGKDSTDALTTTTLSAVDSSVKKNLWIFSESGSARASRPLSP